MIESDPYVPIEEAIELSGFDRATLFRKLGTAELIGKNADEKAANGKTPTLIRVLSLPDAAQLAYWQRELGEGREARGEGAAPNLAEYPAGARHEALRRLPIVLDAIAIMESRDGVSTRIKALAAQHGEGRSTLYGWVDKYRESGFAGLVPGWGKKAGQFYAISDALKTVINDEYLRPTCPSVTTVQRNIEKFCEKARIPAPCVATINRYLATLPAAVVVARRHGEQAYRADAEPKIHRDYLDLAVGQAWVGDHRKLDLFVQEGGKVFRPWITVWMDLRSRAIMGWVAYDPVTGPSSHTIALALRDGILRFGKPQRLYMDNGKDYRADYWGGQHAKYHRDVTLNADSRAVLALLDITVTYAEVRAPWSKAIERWFGNMPAWERQFPGYAGQNAQQRPEKLNAEIKECRLLTMDQLRAELDTFIEAYMDREHSGEGMDGVTPRSLWTPVNKNIPDARALDVILMKHKPAQVYQDGIRVFNYKYWHDALIPHINSTVEVRFDPAKIGELVVSKKNVHICVARSDKPFSMSMTEQEAREIGRRRKKSKQIIRDYSAHRAVVLDPDEAARLVVNQRPAGKVYTLKKPTTPEPGGTVSRPITGFERVGEAVARAQTITTQTESPDPFDARAEEHDRLHEELMGL